MLGEADADGDKEGDTEGEAEADTLGDRDALSEGDLLGDVDGDTDADSEGDSEYDLLGDTDGDADEDSLPPNKLSIGRLGIWGSLTVNEIAQNPMTLHLAIRVPAFDVSVRQRLIYAAAPVK